MKKFMLILIALVLACSFAFAENIDLTNLSVEELHSLRDRIDQELVNRKEFTMCFDYGVGANIPMIQLSSGEEPKLGSFQINDDKSMYIIVENTRDVDFDQYVSDLMNLGFATVLERSRIQFSASNADGYVVMVTNWGSAGISIKGQAPTKKP